MLKFLIWMIVLAVGAWLGATVPLGKRTLFGHVSAVWSTDEAKDMRDGIEKGAKPAIERAERAVKAGLQEAAKPAPGAAPTLIDAALPIIPSATTLSPR